MPKEIYIDENGNERILSSSPSALSGLLDTDITTPSANQVLAYDSNGKVVNTSKGVIKVYSDTVTSDASGFVKITVDNPCIVLSAWSNLGDYIILPFAATGATDEGRSVWWFRICTENLAVRASTNFTLYYAYIEIT